ncbi:hypothetical protein HDU91_005566 [Kappamyces sp. JEL0680]|nr:hypothetical protein HDU91_005566 [Kappamyces sp. JEL0680]
MEQNAAIDVQVRQELRGIFEGFPAKEPTVELAAEAQNLKASLAMQNLVPKQASGEAPPNPQFFNHVGWSPVTLGVPSRLAPGTFEHVKLSFEPRVDKGFFLRDGDSTWTCFRRNHFELTVELSLSISSGAKWHDQSPLYGFLEDGSQKKIRNFEVQLRAVGDSAFKNLKLVQSRPSYKAEEALPLYCEPVQFSRVVFRRMQFNQSTPLTAAFKTPGKSQTNRSLFLVLIVSMVGEDGVVHPIAECKSHPLTVLSGTPSQYKNEHSIDIATAHALHKVKIASGVTKARLSPMPYKPEQSVASDLSARKLKSLESLAMSHQSKSLVTKSIPTIHHPQPIRANSASTLVAGEGMGPHRGFSEPAPNPTGKTKDSATIPPYTANCPAALPEQLDPMYLSVDTSSHGPFGQSSNFYSPGIAGQGHTTFYDHPLPQSTLETPESLASFSPQVFPPVLQMSAPHYSPGSATFSTQDMSTALLASPYGYVLSSPAGNGLLSPTSLLSPAQSIYSNCSPAMLLTGEYTGFRDCSNYVDNWGGLKRDKDAGAAEVVPIPINPDALIEEFFNNI